MSETNPADFTRRFGGIERLYGEAAFAQFQTSRLCVIGVGGVGSWAVEALARSGIGHITLIDLDNIAESNTNRQLHALDPDYGMAKVDAMAKRIQAINPLCEVVTIEDFVTEDNLATLLNNRFDFIIDCMDQLRVKAAIAAWCIRNKQKIIISGGAGGQMDPTQIQIADLSDVTHDPLLSNLRYQLRKQYGFSRDPKKKMRIPCVFSTEQLTYPQKTCQIENNSKGPQGLSCAGFGASMTVTASFGMAAVAYVLKKLLTVQSRPNTPTKPAG